MTARTARIVALTVALIAAGGLTAPAMGTTASDVTPATTSGERFLCAGSRLVDTLVCLDDDVFDPVPPAPGIVPDPRPLLP